MEYLYNRRESGISMATDGSFEQPRCDENAVRHSENHMAERGKKNSSYFIQRRTIGP